MKFLISKNTDDLDCPFGTWICWLSFAFLLAFPSLFADALTLDFPDEGRAAMAIEEKVRSLLPVIEEKDVSKSQILLFYNTQPFFVRMPFRGLSARQDTTFGALTDSERVPWPKDFQNGDIQGAFIVNERLLVIDGEKLSVAVFSWPKMELLSQRSIVWDLIKPAQDRGGEATRAEISILRKKFAQNMLKSPNPKITGAALDSSGWLGTKDINIFLTTHTSTIRLVAMTCNREDLSACQISRACELSQHSSNGAAKDPFRGVAVDVSKRQLVLLNQNLRRIEKWRFNSCFNVNFESAHLLPEQLKKPSNIAFDSKKQLWISTLGADDYRNASVYFWPSP